MKKLLNQFLQQLFPTELQFEVPSIPITEERPLRIGIQGGKGSFNEEAVIAYCEQQDVSTIDIVYLHTSEKVMEALMQGDIDRGHMAIHNSLGGPVAETLEVLGKYIFSVVDNYPLAVSHALMKKKDVPFSEINAIMTHPQVFAQCKNTLETYYGHLEQLVGEGPLIDHATVAHALMKGTIPPTIATMGSRRLADIYDLEMVADHLQDRSDNVTTFIHIEK